MRIEDLKKDMVKGNFLYNGFCNECGIPVTVDAHVTEDGDIDVSGGAVYKKHIGLEDRYFFKCSSCFAKDKTLHNWQPCEIYSRVVGYLRPVNQWNKGKVAEWDARKEFTNMDGK